MLHKLITAALQVAHFKSLDQSNAKRSSEWVRALAEQLGNHCGTSMPNTPVVSFCRGDFSNRAEFRTNELLFDILVAETKPIKAVKGKSGDALSRAIWLVESEFKRTDSRDVLIDLNKLVIGKADNKLLVISSDTTLVEWALETMKNLFDPKESNVFLATIPHPGDRCC